mmetsp:Transcript_8113/g.11302  ORF Transcript_8113/g.11302 Transcript_8113/m.11302 type:complete len:173 (+) Transcript_8113:26-544(+)
MMVCPKILGVLALSLGGAQGLSNFHVDRRATLSGFATSAFIPPAIASVAEPTASTISSGVNREIARKILQIERLNVDSNNNGDPAKHIPKVEISGTKIVCSVPHVMDPNKPHFIEYMWLKDETSDAIIAAKSFQASDSSPPSLTANVPQGVSIVPHIYCNLHGLWIGDTAFV